MLVDYIVRSPVGISIGRFIGSKQPIQTCQSQAELRPETHTFTVTLPSRGDLPTASERQVGRYARPAVSKSRCRSPAVDPPGPANPDKSSRERTLCLEPSRSPVTRLALPLWRPRIGSYSAPMQVRSLFKLRLSGSWLHLSRMHGRMRLTGSSAGSLGSPEHPLPG